MREINIIVCGGSGYMGQEVIRLIKREPALRLAAAVDRSGGDVVLQALSEYTGEADVVIDFSHHSAIFDIMDYCEGRALPAVVATTGHTEEERGRIALAAKKIPVFQSANMSLGVALLAHLVKQAASVFSGFDVEIVEKHHSRKIDAPSGTALLLADAVKESRPDSRYTCGRQGIGRREPNEIGIHSLRMGNVVGEHEVIFSAASQTISLKHEAHDRALFAEGAIAAATFIVGKPAGIYGMENLLTDL